jgi:very-short-patch-repair endonuclease
MYQPTIPDAFADVRRRWVEELPRALVTGRGLIVEHHPEVPTAIWWPGAAVAVTDGTDVVAGGFELLVVTGLTVERLADPAMAKNLLRSATGAVAAGRPVLVFTAGPFGRLKRVGQSTAEPWDLDVSELVAAGELIYLLGAHCALSDGIDEHGGPGARYLTPIERRIAERLAEADVGFIAQAPIGPYTADFLVEGRLVVECDGAAYHDEATDAARDEHIRALGYPTVRLTGRAIHADPDRCLHRIRLALSSVPAPVPTPAVALARAQQRGVVHRDGPALVVAPAGSGKTRVVAERVRRLIADGADPSRICAISFTNAAVDEMKARLRDCPDVKLQTLNSLGNSICREAYGRRHPIDNPKPKMPGRYDVLREVLAPHRYQGKASGLKYWWELIATFRQSLEMPDLTGAPLDGDSQAGKAAAFMRIHQRYEAKLEELGVCDFNGQVLDAVRLLAAEPLLRMQWSSKYDYWIVDEFQDLPAPKLSLLRLLTAPARNLMVVGDDDQIIYGFAGASPLTFSSLERDWADMAPLPLDRNYRCPHDLVIRSGWLIARNTKRIEKHIEPDRPPRHTMRSTCGTAPPTTRTPSNSSRSAAKKAGGGPTLRCCSAPGSPRPRWNGSSRRRVSPTGAWRAGRSSRIRPCSGCWPGSTSWPERQRPTNGAASSTARLATCPRKPSNT